MLLHQEREQMQDTIEDAHRQGLEQGAEEMRRRKDREIRQMDIVWQDRLDAINREREVSCHLRGGVVALQLMVPGVAPYLLSRFAATHMPFCVATLTIARVPRRCNQDTVSDEFNSKVHELSARFRLKQSPVVCQEAQNSVLQCYQSNKTTSLNCNEQVRAFVQCVETARFNYLSSTATGTATGTKRA